jgi:hypothetical protein
MERIENKWNKLKIIWRVKRRRNNRIRENSERKSNNRKWINLEIKIIIKKRNRKLIFKRKFIIKKVNKSLEWLKI